MHACVCDIAFAYVFIHTYAYAYEYCLNTLEINGAYNSYYLFNNIAYTAHWEMSIYFIRYTICYGFFLLNLFFISH